MEYKSILVFSKLFGITSFDEVPNSSNYPANTYAYNRSNGQWAKSFFDNQRHSGKAIQQSIRWIIVKPETVPKEYRTQVLLLT